MQKLSQYYYRYYNRAVESVKWRLSRFRIGLYSVKEVAFWAGDADDASWYPDLGKLAAIHTAINIDARKATSTDLDLFLQYHERMGRPLKPRRIRKMHKRWSEGCTCYIALDSDHQIVSYMWVAWNDLYVEDIGRVFRVKPDEGLLFDLETRLDRQGSMGFVACSCVALAEMTQRELRRIVAWSTPELFRKFHHFHWWTGLGELKPLHIERCYRIFGIWFRRVRPFDAERLQK